MMRLKKPVTVKMTRLKDYDGTYHPSLNLIRIDKHSGRPYVRVLLHEFLHHLKPKATEKEIRKLERWYWNRITQKDHEYLQSIIRKIKRYAKVCIGGNKKRR